MNESRRWARRSGFTLIEIIIAMAILSIFMGVIYSSFLGTIHAVKSTEELKDSFHPARAILQRIQCDLKGAIHRPRTPGKLDEELYVFNGIDAYDGSPERDRIDFVTCANIITKDGTPQSDLSEISYYVDPKHYEKGYLVRRMDIYPDKEPAKGGELKIIGENVVGLNFKYFLRKKKAEEEALSDKEKEKEKEDLWELVADPECWRDEWDWKKHPYLPIMVRIELTLREDGGEETTFNTVVYLNRDQRTVTAANRARLARERAGEETAPRETINVEEIRRRKRVGPTE